MQNFTDIPLSDSDYRLFSELIYAQSGICLGQNKRDLVKARLLKRLRLLGLKSYREYYNRVVSDSGGGEMTELIDAVSTNITSFFRERQHFDFLASRALPELLRLKRRTGTMQLRLWCAACSTGEEVYSLLITVLETLGAEAPSWDVKILGTDICTKVLSVALGGAYPPEKLRGVPPQLVNRYFERARPQDSSAAFRLKDEFRGRVVLRRMNLMCAVFPFRRRFDVIFCRNVMIYFDKPTQTRLVGKMFNCLEDSGFLFVGHSESLLGLESGFEGVAPAVYRKRAKSVSKRTVNAVK